MIMSLGISEYVFSISLTSPIWTTGSEQRGKREVQKIMQISYACNSEFYSVACFVLYADVI